MKTKVKNITEVIKITAMLVFGSRNEVIEAYGLEEVLAID